MCSNHLIYGEKKSTIVYWHNMLITITEQEGVEQLSSWWNYLNTWTHVYWIPMFEFIEQKEQILCHLHLKFMNILHLFKISQTLAIYVFKCVIYYYHPLKLAYKRKRSSKGQPLWWGLMYIAFFFVYTVQYNKQWLSYSWLHISSHWSLLKQY